MDDLRSSAMTGRGAETTRGRVSTRTVAEGDGGGEVFADLGRGDRRVGRKREVQGSGRGGVGCLCVVGGVGCGCEDQVAKVDLFDFAEPRAGDDECFIAGVKFNSGDGRGLREGARRELVGLRLIVLLDGEVKVAGREVMLERESECEDVRCVGFWLRLEGNEQWAGVLRVSSDGVDAGGTGGIEQQRGGVAGNEVEGRFLAGAGGRNDGPVGAGKLLETDRGAGKAVEAPAAGDHAGEEGGLWHGLGRWCCRVRCESGVSQWVRAR